MFVCPITSQDAAIQLGRIKVKGRVVNADYVIQDGDWVTHECHRHEPPVW